MVRDMERPPLDQERLRRAVLTGGLWTGLTVVEETGSSNADVAVAARDGAPEGLVVVAEHQRTGRGRAGRNWSSPPRAGLAVSALLRPGGPGGGWPAVPPARWAWLPLLAGVAVVEAVHRRTGLTAALKWPNDVLLAGHKVAGVLVEVTGDAVVMGIGVNVTMRGDELPAPVPDGQPATSLALAGAPDTDRAGLLRELLVRVEWWYGRWRAGGGDADAAGLRKAYLRACATVGQTVRASLPDGSTLTGTATTVDGSGRLVVSGTDGGPSQVLAAGDVVHLRPG